MAGDFVECVAVAAAALAYDLAYGLSYLVLDYWGGEGYYYYFCDGCCVWG